jgi:hypothetical protein
MFYIDASSAETIEADIQAIAILDQAGTTSADALAWLERCKNWLMIFDNADDSSLDLRQYFPRCSHGDIIITTRNYGMVNLARGTSAHCKVSGMQPEEAKALLLKISGAKTTWTTEEYSAILVKVRLQHTFR